MTNAPRSIRTTACCGNPVCRHCRDRVAVSTACAACQRLGCTLCVPTECRRCPRSVCDACMRRCQRCKQNRLCKGEFRDDLQLHCATCELALLDSAADNRRRAKLIEEAFDIARLDPGMAANDNF